MKERVFGKMPDGRTVKAYLLTNGRGAAAEVLNIGATVRSLSMPDREGRLSDVVLGCDTVDDYLASPYFGAVVGRYGNRIARGRFTLNGHEHALAVNNGENHLHGGGVGFNQRYWAIERVRAESGEAVKAALQSPDGEEGYPGNLDLAVTITLTGENVLRFEYVGTADLPTIVNPTHHGYFNLSGDLSSSILDHRLQINAETITPVDGGLIPTGDFMTVAGTPMDFNTQEAVGARIDADFEQLRYGGGYDHNYVLNNYEKGRVREAATVFHPGSGRTMTVYTDQPGVQLYTGNFLDGTITGKGGTAYPRRSGLCLETQHHPDSPNHPAFPSVVLRPGETYRHVTEYRFGSEIGG